MKALFVTFFLVASIAYCDCPVGTYAFGEYDSKGVCQFDKDKMETVLKLQCELIGTVLDKGSEIEYSITGDKEEGDCYIDAESFCEC